MVPNLDFRCDFCIQVGQPKMFTVLHMSPNQFVGHQEPKQFLQQKQQQQHKLEIEEKLNLEDHVDLVERSVANRSMYSTFEGGEGWFEWGKVIKWAAENVLPTCRHQTI